MILNKNLNFDFAIEIIQIKDVKKVDSLKAINHYFNIAGYKDQGC